ncbi:META domain-containing protein [Aestuariirhabdus sp. LZHN29]|uniref:META domain-containing protein n=1 Tax=Aestuariirhabdus sp. LZHN29 TaxID=3417462 RepID=UPI003CF40836
MIRSTALLMTALIGLAGCATAPDQPTAYPLKGNWVLEQLVIDGSVISLPVRAKLQLSAKSTDNGRINGHGGCNGFFGGYSVDKQKIKIGPLGSTMMACPEPLMQQEQQLLQAVSSATSFQHRGDTLVLTSDDGAIRLTLTPLPPQ